MRARSLGSLPGKVLDVGLVSIRRSRGENGNGTCPSARKIFPSRQQYSHVRRPGADSNINSLLVGSPITLTKSLSADSKGDEIPFVSCSTSGGFAAISSVERVNMDSSSNWVDFDSLVRNSRECLQIAGNNKIRALIHKNMQGLKQEYRWMHWKNRLMRSNWNKHRSESKK